MNVNITADVAPLLAKLAQFQDQFVPAVLRTLVRTRDQATKPALVNAVASNTGLSPFAVEAEVTVKDPSADDQVASVIASGERFPIMDFKAQQTGLGVTYTLSGGRGFIPHAFIATMRSGHTGVFARRSPSVRRSRGAWTPNLPIVEQFGPSVARIVEKDGGVQEAVTQRTLEALPGFLGQEIDALARENDLAA